MRVNTVSVIVESHRKGVVTPPETIRRCYERIRALGDPGIFITLRDEGEAIAEAQALKDNSGFYGVPVVVKDNIDVAGMPTTAACPAFAYQAEEDAEAVRRLKGAGAIVFGKSNLDQLATGLGRMSTPHPRPREPMPAAVMPRGYKALSGVLGSRGCW